MIAAQDPSDDHLIGLALHGDEDAFGVLVGRYQDYIFHLCWRVTRDRADAEDLTQECFLKLHRHLSGWKPGNKLSNWLYTVALNDCRKRLRRRKIAAFFSLDACDAEDKPLMAEPRAGGPDAGALAEDAQGRAILSACVLALPDDMRQAFVLRYELDRDIAEVAEALGRSAVATRVLLHRARLRLRKALAEKGLQGLTPPPAGDTDEEEA